MCNLELEHMGVDKPECQFTNMRDFLKPHIKEQVEQATTWQRKMSLIMSEPLLPEAHCRVHRRLCRVRRATCTTAGTPCVHHSRYGQLAKLDGEHSDIRIIWCRQRMDLREPWFIHENVAGQDDGLVKQLTGEIYSVEELTISPTRVGWKSKRTRLFQVGEAHAIVHRWPSNLFAEWQFIDQIVKDLFDRNATFSMDEYWIGTEQELEDERSWAANRTKVIVCNQAEQTITAINQRKPINQQEAAQARRASKERRASSRYARWTCLSCLLWLIEWLSLIAGSACLLCLIAEVRQRWGEPQFAYLRTEFPDDTPDSFAGSLLPTERAWIKQHYDKITDVTKRGQPIECSPDGDLATLIAGNGLLWHPGLGRWLVLQELWTSMGFPISFEDQRIANITCQFSRGLAANPKRSFASQRRQVGNTMHVNVMGALHMSLWFRRPNAITGGCTPCLQRQPDSASSVVQDSRVKRRRSRSASKGHQKRPSVSRSDLAWAWEETFRAILYSE